MKYLILTTLTALSSLLHAQNLRPFSANVSYFGETITHPGIKLGVTYNLTSWEKNKIKKNGNKKQIKKNIGLSPAIGFFHHKDYQTGVFVLPELSYSRRNGKGNYKSVGAGAGYMKTIIPNVYEQKLNGEIKKINGGYNYFLSNYFVMFGKDLSIKTAVPAEVYIKPQLMYALPNYTRGTLYFALEIGLKYKLNKN